MAPHSGGSGRFLLFALLGITTACASGEFVLPEPRRLVVHSGERITAPKERMEVVHDWVSEEVDSITLDPSFMIVTSAMDGPVYPWDGFTISEDSDTAEIRVQNSAFEARGPYMIYAHLHLMAAQDRLDRWLPEAPMADGYDLERAIMSRMADAWLYQRTIFDARPYGLLDELIYAKEHGYLDAFILTARPDAFVEARREWLADSPDESESYREWFRRVFQREPPGLRGGTTSS